MNEDIDAPTKNTKKMLILIGVVIVGVILSMYRRNYLENKIRKNPIVVCATIINMRGGKGVNVIYKFELNGKEYKYNKLCPENVLEKYDAGQGLFFFSSR